MPKMKKKRSIIVKFGVISNALSAEPNTNLDSINNAEEEEINDIIPVISVSTNQQSLPNSSPFIPIFFGFRIYYDMIGLFFF